MATIDERLESLTQSVELLTHDTHELQATVKQLAEMQEKTDKRIRNLLTITLNIGADFAERLKKLEEKDGEG